jgi:hypothetical protein
MASDYKCKHCGMEFENKGEELAHYREFKNGSCAKEAVKEGVPERDQTSIPKPLYDKEAEAIDFTDQQGIEAQVTAIARKTAEELKTFPKEKVMIPKDKLNPQDSYAVVGINGWNLQIQRGVPVVLPVPVVELLEDGGYSPTRVR